MKYYIVKTMSKSIIRITEEDYENNIKGATSGMVYTKHSGAFNLPVDSIIPESDYLLEKADNNKGVLHDGQKVIKKFGRWYLESDQSICMDPQYYEEIAQDCVPTLEEFNQRYLRIKEEDRLQLMLKSSELKRDIKQLRSGKGLTKI